MNINCTYIYITTTALPCLGLPLECLTPFAKPIKCKKNYEVTNTGLHTYKHVKVSTIYLTNKTDRIGNKFDRKTISNFFPPIDVITNYIWLTQFVKFYLSFLYFQSIKFPHQSFMQCTNIPSN